MSLNLLQKIFVVSFCCIPAAFSCKSPGGPESAPATRRITMPENPEYDSRARKAVAIRTEILANKIELFLPPALYSELTIAPNVHKQDEFQTEYGRRISIKPPADGVPVKTPARVNCGEWRLASHGPIEILFITEKDAAAARIRATGVSLLFRDSQKHQNISRVDVDDDRYSIRRTP
ncbi:MAG: hypothetical protein ACKVS6_09110 [Planctomycetota bacterium]